MTTVAIRKPTMQRGISIIVMLTDVVLESGEMILGWTGINATAVPKSKVK